MVFSGFVLGARFLLHLPAARNSRVALPGPSAIGFFP